MNRKIVVDKAGTRRRDKVWPLIASVAAVDGAACSDRVPALTRCGSSGWRTLGGSEGSKPDLLGASTKEDAEHQKLMQGIRRSSWGWVSWRQAEGDPRGNRRETGERRA